MVINDSKYLNIGTEITLNVSAKTIKLNITNNLTEDGVTFLALYTKIQEIWSLLNYNNDIFPFVKNSNISYLVVNGWDFADNATKLLIKNGGWSLRNTAEDVSKEEWINIITNSSYGTKYQFSYIQTNTGTPTNFSTTGNQNTVIKIYGDSTHGNFDHRTYLKIFVTLNDILISSVDNSTLGFSTLLYQSYTFSMPTVNVLSYDYILKGSLQAKSVISNNDRYTISTWDGISINLNGTYISANNSLEIDISDSSYWDTIAPTAGNRAGEDLYLYGINGGGFLQYKFSTNSVAPSGYNESSSKKLGGFHCLCADVGTISGHTLSNYVAGDILPASIWHLEHRPFSNPKGMVYSSGLDKWIDIYLASLLNNQLSSVYGGTIEDGASTEMFNFYKFIDWFGVVGKTIPYLFDFLVYSAGSNQGTNISTSDDPITTGGHIDTASRRMISNIGCEDCCGAMWQWGMDTGYSNEAWKAGYGAIDSNVAGAINYEATRVLLGGSYSSSSYSGSRAADYSISPFTLGSTYAIRGISHSKK